MDAVKDVLNSTRPLLSPLIMSDYCFDSLVMDLNILDVPCLKEAVSKAAGYGIVVFSSILKLPLISNIVTTASVDGLSTTSVYLETTMYASTLIYHAFLGSPFSTYGEKYILLAQNIVVIFFIVLYGRKTAGFALMSAIGFALSVAGMVNLPEEYRPLLILYSGSGAIFARSPQIYTNLKNGHTGVLSLFTFAAAVVGGIVRLLTILQEVDDTIAALGDLLPLAFNTFILFQILYYRRATMEHFAKLKKE
mmetsp:Transcript_18186/g.35719  ORF Transcript_18186/g.35719 Transcript_18186/m.35719 type:complete len:250 (+) Transcript_18186:188-937(+)|eukprot:CAMPEP_0171502448 /NCGR_PEP_ID=MMETSP0958-20121227/10184_1 /TAXON_ID=87120 /ORGANISM="Aurantiochytrium limacinum, Strain ATCCMYA-1381" /LENGTH=249 /DNA_ID=CAMNT_0012037505 /DNA_START=140 /DNA_END=889 /DNA_ORIENTATION=-